MICSIGSFLILLAIVLIPFQILSCFSNQFLLKRIKVIHCILIGGSYALLVFGFITQTPEILGVLIHSSVDHPFYYRIGSTWSYHQGSMLLWVFFMSLVSLKLPNRALGFFSFFQFYFLILLYFKASPFIEVPFGDFSGRGMNPLLEDSALLYHPLFLYMGYILIFATWSIILANQSIFLKKWVFASWIFLSLGLISGSFWAFYEVGWGGWWFWDPVENIALIPWLLLVGCLHLFKKQDENNFFLKVLIFLSFMFAFLGVFTVRMGLIRSIHNFTQTSDNIGFVFIGICFIFASVLFLFRNRNKTPSLELGRYIPGILGSLFAMLIAMATFFPLFTGFEVSNNYYTKIIVPLSVLYPLSLAFTILPFQAIKENKKSYIIVGILCGVFMGCLFAFKKTYFIPFVFVCMICICIGVSLWIKKNINGSTISHAGFVVFILGVCFNHFLYMEQEVTLGVNESVGSVQLNHVKFMDKAHYKTEIAEIKLDEVKLYPERRYYKNYDIIRQKVDFSVGLFNIYYAYIIDRLEKGHSQKWIIKFQYHPLISWIWLGGLLMVFGGVMTLYGYRRR